VNILAAVMTRRVLNEVGSTSGCQIRLPQLLAKMSGEKIEHIPACAEQ